MTCKSICLLLVCLVLSSCVNDSTIDLIEIIPGAPATYSGNVKSIIDNNCLACHGTVPANGAPMSLTTFQNVKDAVANRGLIGRISSDESTSGHMPLGGPRLPQNLIDIIIQWQADGFPE